MAGCEVIDHRTYATLIAAERVFVWEDGERLPVAGAYDADGDECDLDDAVFCVAGPDKDGLFAHIDMTLQPVIQ
jgi:hypothetical protein